MERLEIVGNIQYQNADYITDFSTTTAGLKQTVLGTLPNYDPTKITKKINVYSWK
jgi:hypothetical protein